MTFVTITSGKAQKELALSWEWYEERQNGLGDQFAEAIFNRIREIELHPERYAVVYKSYRQTAVDTFPFLVIYRIAKKEKLVRIVSIFHMARSPKRKYRSARKKGK
ncbi:hypothetical protein BH10BAC3_BH10BAC3_28960 [soil metagenome]